LTGRLPSPASAGVDNDEDVVLVKREGAVMTITINRPRVRNAVDLRTAAGISRALDELHASDRLLAGIITGAGGTFCVGADLKALARGELPRTERGFAGICRRPPAKPVIAAVEGFALGGGTEVALACDLVVAARTASFGLPEVKRGLIASAGGLLRLPGRIPYHIAMELILTGAPLPAERAERLGLVNQLTEHGEALAGARELAQAITANGPLAVTAAKRVVVESASWAPAEMFDRQEPIFEQVKSSADAREGAAAFAERRAPVWQGR
jgi:enoyl-CoA hydratase